MADNDENVAGVGGWLALLVFFMAVITPAVAIVNAAGALYGGLDGGLAYDAEGQQFQILEWTIAATIVVICWFIAWRLLQVKRWQTVRFTIAGLWVIAIGSTVAELMGISAISGTPLDDLIDLARWEPVRPLAFAALWTVYLLRSRRVANTYGRDSRAAEVFG